MKIASFNINNIRRRLTNLLEWLRQAKPDVVCLQELKATDAEFPAEALRRAGYDAVWRGQKSWNGVAILARGVTPIVTRTELPGDPADTQSRYIEAAVSGVLFASFYAPNGNPQPGPKFDYKLNWMKRFNRHAAALYKAKIPVVLAGDYQRGADRAGYLCHKVLRQRRAPSAREPRGVSASPGARLDRRDPDAASGDVDVQFWDYKRKRWARDAGLRLDQILLSSELAGRLVAADVDRAVRGKDNASDHAPVWAELRETATPRKIAHTNSRAGAASQGRA